MSAVHKGLAPSDLGARSVEVCEPGLPLPSKGAKRGQTGAHAAPRCLNGVSEDASSARPFWRLPSPVFTFCLTRDTNAPLSVIEDQIRQSESPWHPRHKRLLLKSTEIGTFECLHPRRFFVEESERFRFIPQGDRVQLCYEVRFKGWPVLMAMGWYRFQLRRIWESFVEQL